MSAAAISEGRVSFVLKSRKMTDLTPCRFRAAEASGVTVDTVKHPDGTVDIEVDGPHGRAWSFKTRPSFAEVKEFEAAVTWDATSVALHLAGSKVDEQSL